MMTWLIVLLLVLVILFATTTLLAASRAEKTADKLYQVKQCLRASTWLCGHHVRFAVALQDYISEKENVSFDTVYKLVRKQISMASRQRPLLYMPLSICPDDLRQAASIYNEYVMAEWPTLYGDKRYPEETSEQQYARLTEAIGLMIHTRYSRYTGTIAKETGQANSVVDAVVRSLQTHMERDVMRMMGAPDPEKVLPAIY